MSDSPSSDRLIISDWVADVVKASEAGTTASARLVMLDGWGGAPIATTLAMVDYSRMVARLRREFPAKHPGKEIVIRGRCWYEREQGAGSWSDRQGVADSPWPELVKNGFGLLGLLTSASSLSRERNSRRYRVKWQRRAVLGSALEPIQVCFGLPPAVGWVGRSPRAEIELDAAGRLHTMTFGVAARRRTPLVHHLEMFGFGEDLVVDDRID